MKDRLLKYLQKFGDLNEQEWDLVRSKFNNRILKRNTYFLEQGQICSKLGFVVEGFFRTYTIDNKGQEITTHFAYPNSFLVSFYSFKNQLPSFEYIQATEDSQILEISIKDLSSLHQQIPFWGMLNSGIVEEAYACMEQRNFILQTATADEKYRRLIENGNPDILQKAQLGHISSYLGIKQETLSRIRRKK